MTQGTERACVFIGGPYDGWDGHFYDVDQTFTFYGEPGMENDIYDRMGKPRHDGKIKFKWNAKLSAEKWKQWAIDHNLPPEMFQQQTKRTIRSDGQVDEEAEAPKVQVSVKHNADKKRWELLLLGQVEAVVDESEIGVPNPAKPHEHAERISEWVKSLGIAR